MTTRLTRMLENGRHAESHRALSRRESARVERSPKLRADGAKAVRFTEVDVRAVGSEPTTGATEALESATRSTTTTASLSSARRRRRSGGTRRVARRARAIAERTRSRTPCSRARRRATTPLLGARRAPRWNHRRGAPRGVDDPDARARATRQARREGGGVGATRAEPRARIEHVTLTTITTSDHRDRYVGGLSERSLGAAIVLSRRIRPSLAS